MGGPRISNPPGDTVRKRRKQPQAELPRPGGLLQVPETQDQRTGVRERAWQGEHWPSTVAKTHRTRATQTSGPLNTEDRREMRLETRQRQTDHEHHTDLKAKTGGELQAAGESRQHAEQHRAGSPDGGATLKMPKGESIRSVGPGFWTPT